jgi:hypothetical protein
MKNLLTDDGVRTNVSNWYKICNIGELKKKSWLDWKFSFAFLWWEDFFWKGVKVKVNKIQDIDGYD